MHMIRILAHFTSRAPVGAASKRYLKLRDFDDFKFGNCVFLVVFFKTLSIMSRRKQRSGFDQIFEFNKRRIVTYRDCGLSYRKIGTRVGRNHTAIIRICDRWMIEGKTDRRGQSPSPQCTTSH
ncbi:uncharacterized protein TNCV_551601 [Trichonephila clavipes]|nr:uncharacterized protein TNCV_551601 [Trichonephila clavipes]